MISKFFIQSQRRFGKVRRFAVLDQDMQVRYRGDRLNRLEFNIESVGRNLSPLNGSCDWAKKGFMNMFSNELIIKDEHCGAYAWIDPKDDQGRKPKPRKAYDFTLSNGVNYRTDHTDVRQVYGCHLHDFGFGVLRSLIPWQGYIKREMEVGVLDGLIRVAVYY